MAKAGRASHKDDHSINRRISKQKEQKQVVDDRLHKHFEPYAKATCLSLCEKVRIALPREIRDIIYDYLHAHDIIYVGPEYLCKSDQPCESDRGAHYWDAAYVSDAMKLELVESWYRTTLFYFYDKANNIQVVDRFLVTDRWGLDIRPHDFICRVRFDLGPGDNKLHNTPHCCNVMGLADTLTKPLKNLHQLPNYTHFFIRIHTYRGLEFGCLAGEELQRTVESLTSDLKALRAAGHRFILQWPELHDLEFCSKSCGYEPDVWIERIEDVGISEPVK